MLSHAQSRILQESVCISKIVVIYHSTSLLGRGCYVSHLYSQLSTACIATCRRCLNYYKWEHCKCKSARWEQKDNNNNHKLNPHLCNCFLLSCQHLSLSVITICAEAKLWKVSEVLPLTLLLSEVFPFCAPFTVIFSNGRQISKQIPKSCFMVPCPSEILPLLRPPVSPVVPVEVATEHLGGESFALPLLHPPEGDIFTWRRYLALLQIKICDIGKGVWCGKDVINSLQSRFSHFYALGGLSFSPP